MSVHGINTHGVWEMELAPLISEQGWIAYPLHYGAFGLLNFLRPSARNRQIEWFRDKYNQARDRYPNVAPSVIAHSFGTYIVTQALSKYPGIKLDKLILSGSIVKRNFDFAALFKNKQITYVRNDFGGKDNVVSMAPWVASETGSSGSDGFLLKHDRLIDIPFPAYTHSSAFGWDHYQEYWIPFLRQPFTYEGESTPLQIREEPVDAMDAARWSAITYFHQFIRPLMESLSTSGFKIAGSSGAGETEFDLDALYVVLPRTPAGSERSAVRGYCEQIGAREFTVQNMDRKRDLKIVGTRRLFDIPTIVNSLIFLDHRNDEELSESIRAFSEMLQSQVASTSYSTFADRVKILGEDEFRSMVIQ